MIKPWYKSRTKIGAVLVGSGMILTVAGKFLLGELDAAMALAGFITGVGIVFTAVGLRDAIEKK